MGSRLFFYLLHAMDTLKRTPLFEFHRRNAARFVPFGGWEMPVQYTGILEEHRAVRSTVGLFDVSHMGEARVTGKDAGALLDRVMTNAISSTAAGQAVYSLMCNPGGGVVDDLIVYCIQPGVDYLVCLNASNTTNDLDWMQSHSSGFDCRVDDVSAAMAQIAIQGPAFDAVLKGVGLDAELPDRFKFQQVEWQGAEILLCRTGYTGEDGVEVYLPADHAIPFADAVWQAMQAVDGKLAGLGARDSLRLEAGFPLYGHEIDDSISPIEAGLAWTIRWDKSGGFIGQQALEEQKAAGRQRRIVHFILDDKRIARPESPVFLGDRQVGTVVSGTQSPILGRPVGSALVSVDSAKAGGLEVEIRGKRIPLLINRPPLHKVEL